MTTMRTARFVTILSGCVVAAGFVGCGPPHNPDIVYKKLTPAEFAKLPPEERETPEVQENMGAEWKDPNLSENATNPKRRKRR